MKYELHEGAAFFTRLSARREEYRAVKQFLDCLKLPYVTKACYEKQATTDSKLVTFSTLQDVCARAKVLSGRFPVTLQHKPSKEFKEGLPLNVLLDLKRLEKVFKFELGAMQDVTAPHAVTFTWPFYGHYVLHNWQQRFDDADSMIVNTMVNGTKIVIEPWEPFMKAVVRKLRGE